jgi:ankyrin repeat protein
MKRLLLALLPLTLFAAEPTATIDEAIAKGDAADVKRHLAANPALLRTPGAGKMLPLHQAALRRKADLVTLFLEAGAPVDATEAANRTALHMAVERGDLAIVKLLLAKKAATAIRDRNGWTPLHHAAAKDRLEIARALLDAGADMVQLLLARGTNPAIRSKPGVTALDLAREYKNAAAIEILERPKK